MAVGDLLDAGKLFFRDIFACSLPLLGDEAVGGLVAGALPARDRWDDGAGGDDFVCFQALDLGNSFGVGGVAGGVDDEKVVGCLFSNDTARLQSIHGSALA